jgi:adenine-specific DNA methylase
LDRAAFLSLSYDERLNYCCRPEQIDGPSPESWAVINDHLGTAAASLPELVKELGERRFGRIPRVGDSFCGGGSIPFEAARIGCEAYGSDLNPVAVLLVLRKQTSGETAFLDEVYQEVEAGVHRQLDSMKDLDDANDPNFGDTDYQLAACAAALRVLTAKRIEEIDVAYELTRKRQRNEKSAVEEIIEKAVRIACDHLVPRGLAADVWKSLTAAERLYVKGLELESHGERRSGVFQELARGFGVDQYTPLMASSKANEARLKTASEFGRREMGEAGFGGSLVRHALFAALKTTETESTRDGITWLRTEVPNYAGNHGRVIEILEFLASLRQNASMAHWHKDAQAAALLAGALRNRDDNV